MAVTVSRSRRAPGAPTSLDVATDLGIDDILVFVRIAGGFRLLGGSGRGFGWADIVEVRTSDEPIADRAWRAGVPIRTTAPKAVRVIGPYWARESVTVPVGHEHLVVFGGSGASTVSDAYLVRAAARVVGETQEVSPEKLLADELELVHAVRALMAYRAETVRDTARHIALVAARALSCDVAAIHVDHGDPTSMEMVRLGGADGFETDAALAGPDAPRYLLDATRLTEPLVEQSVDPASRVWLEEVVSRLTLPIGGSEPFGALSLGHAAARPRGFTVLCQRIGRALAEAAELLLSQAIVRERLAAEHVLLRRVSLTDALTGIGNRAAWDDALGALVAADEGGVRPFAVISTDLDGLKAVNDRYGHATGDTVLRGAANLLRASTREGDLLVRLGGDEFAILMDGTNEHGVRDVVRRIARNMRSWRVTEYGLAPQMSVGWAVGTGDPIPVACIADERMYRAKRRRTRGRTPDSGAPRRSARVRTRSVSLDRRARPGDVPAVSAAPSAASDGSDSGGPEPTPPASRSEPSLRRPTGYF